MTALFFCERSDKTAPKYVCYVKIQTYVKIRTNWNLSAVSWRPKGNEFSKYCVYTVFSSGRTGGLLQIPCVQAEIVMLPLQLPEDANYVIDAAAFEACVLHSKK